MRILLNGTPLLQSIDIAGAVVSTMALRIALEVRLRSAWQRFSDRPPPARRAREPEPTPPRPRLQHQGPEQERAEKGGEETRCRPPSVPVSDLIDHRQAAGVPGRDQVTDLGARRKSPGELFIPANGLTVIAAEIAEPVAPLPRRLVAITTYQFGKPERAGDTAAVRGPPVRYEPRSR
jgi:hypothetical protein